jgi:hypothetical protein
MWNCLNVIIGLLRFGHAEERPQGLPQAELGTRLEARTKPMTTFLRRDQFFHTLFRGNDGSL